MVKLDVSVVNEVTGGGGVRGPMDYASLTVVIGQSLDDVAAASQDAVHIRHKRVRHSAAVSAADSCGSHNPQLPFSRLLPSMHSIISH